MGPVLAVLFRYHDTALWLVSVASTVFTFGSWLILCHGAALLFLLLNASQPTLAGVLDLLFLLVVTMVLLFKLSFSWSKKRFPLALVSRNISPIPGLLTVLTFLLLCVFQLLCFLLWCSGVGSQTSTLTSQIQSDQVCLGNGHGALSIALQKS